LQAALKGAEQIGFTIMSLTVSLVAVLIPVLFMGDIVGRLFREFAVTLCVTILISAIVSPDAHADDVRPSAAPEERDLGGMVVPDIGELFRGRYPFLRPDAPGDPEAPDNRPDRGRGDADPHRRAVHRRAERVLPGAGHGRHPRHLRGASDDFIPRDARRQQALAKIILEDPAVESLSMFIGVDGVNTTLNSGRVLINLKPLAARQISATEVMHRLEPELAKVEGITLYMQPIQDLTVEDRVSRTQYQYTLEGPDLDELHIWTGSSSRKSRRCRRYATCDRRATRRPAGGARH